MSAARVVGPVTSGAGAGYAAALLIRWVFETATGIDIPEDVQDALGFLLTFAGGYLVKRGAHAAD